MSSPNYFPRKARCSGTMTAIPISEFRTHACQIIGEVAENKEGFVLTKRGKPIVEVHPIDEEHEREIDSPLGAQRQYD